MQETFMFIASPSVATRYQKKSHFDTLTRCFQSSERDDEQYDG